MALFTLAVSAASSVNSPVLRRLLRSSEDAQAPRPASAAAAKVAAMNLRFDRSIGRLLFRGALQEPCLKARALHRLAGLPDVDLPLGPRFCAAAAVPDLADPPCPAAPPPGRIRG